MASFNKVILLGNVTRDPEIRYTPKGTAVTELGMAVNRVYSTDSGEKREEVLFVDVTLWGRTAEIAGNAEPASNVHAGRAVPTIRVGCMVQSRELIAAKDLRFGSFLGNTS